MNKLLTTLTIASAIAFPQNALALTASITNSTAIDLTYDRIANSASYTHTFNIDLGAGQSFDNNSPTDDLVITNLAGVSSVVADSSLSLSGIDTTSANFNATSNSSASSYQISITSSEPILNGDYQALINDNGNPGSISSSFNSYYVPADTTVYAHTLTVSLGTGQSLNPDSPTDDLVINNLAGVVGVVADAPFAVSGSDETSLNLNVTNTSSQDSFEVTILSTEEVLEGEYQALIEENGSPNFIADRFDSYSSSDSTTLYAHTLTLDLETDEAFDPDSPTDDLLINNLNNLLGATTDGNFSLSGLDSTSANFNFTGDSSESSYQIQLVSDSAILNEFDYISLTGDRGTIAGTAVPFEFSPNMGLGFLFGMLGLRNIKRKLSRSQ